MPQTILQRLHKRQQIFVELVTVGQREAVRRVVVHLQRGVLIISAASLPVLSNGTIWSLLP